MNRLTLDGDRKSNKVEDVDDRRNVELAEDRSYGKAWCKDTSRNWTAQNQSCKEYFLNQIADKEFVIENPFVLIYMMIMKRIQLIN